MVTDSPDTNQRLIISSQRDSEHRLGQVRAATSGAARRTGQALSFGKGVAAVQACGGGDEQSLAVSGKTLGEVCQMIGHGFFRDADQL